MPVSFSPRERLLLVYRLWWLVACMGILGGLVGWLVHKTQDPIYESSIAFAVTIDLAQTGPLDDRAEDRYQQAFANVFFSQPIIKETLRTAAERGIQIDRPLFNRVSSYEWHIAVWEFTIRHNDPVFTQVVAEAWAEAATAELRTALGYAIEAQTLQDYITALVTCEDEFAVAPAPADCTLPKYEDIDGEIEALNARREEALKRSLSLTSAMSFEQTKAAALPEEPVTTGQAQIVFYSGMIGLIAGIWLVNIYPRFSHQDRT